MEEFGENLQVSVGILNQEVPDGLSLPDEFDKRFLAARNIFLDKDYIKQTVQTTDYSDANIENLTTTQLFCLYFLIDDELQDVVNSGNTTAAFHGFLVTIYSKLNDNLKGNVFQYIFYRILGSVLRNNKFPPELPDMYIDPDLPYPFQWLSMSCRVKSFGETINYSVLQLDYIRDHLNENVLNPNIFALDKGYREIIAKGIYTYDFDKRAGEIYKSEFMPLHERSLEVLKHGELRFFKDFKKKVVGNSVEEPVEIQEVTTLMDILNDPQAYIISEKKDQYQQSLLSLDRQQYVLDKTVEEADYSDNNLSNITPYQLDCLFLWVGKNLQAITTYDELSKFFNEWNTTKYFSLIRSSTYVRFFAFWFHLLNLEDLLGDPVDKINEYKWLVFEWIRVRGKEFGKKYDKESFLRMTEIFPNISSFIFILDPKFGNAMKEDYALEYLQNNRDKFNIYEYHNKEFLREFGDLVNYLENFASNPTLSQPNTKQTAAINLINTYINSEVDLKKTINLLMVSDAKAIDISEMTQQQFIPIYIYIYKKLSNIHSVEEFKNYIETNTIIKIALRNHDLIFLKTFVIIFEKLKLDLILNGYGVVEYNSSNLLTWILSGGQAFKGPYTPESFEESMQLLSQYTPQEVTSILIIDNPLKEYLAELTSDDKYYRDNLGSISEALNFNYSYYSQFSALIKQIDTQLKPEKTAQFPDGIVNTLNAQIPTDSKEWQHAALSLLNAQNVMLSEVRKIIDNKLGLNDTQNSQVAALYMYLHIKLSSVDSVTKLIDILNTNEIINKLRQLDNPLFLIILGRLWGELELYKLIDTSTLTIGSLGDLTDTCVYYLFWRGYNYPNNYSQDDLDRFLDQFYRDKPHNANTSKLIGDYLLMDFNLYSKVDYIFKNLKEQRYEKLKSELVHLKAGYNIKKFAVDSADIVILAAKLTDRKLDQSKPISIKDLDITYSKHDYIEIINRINLHPQYYFEELIRAVNEDNLTATPFTFFFIDCVIKTNIEAVSNINELSDILNTIRKIHNRNEQLDLIIQTSLNRISTFTHIRIDERDFGAFQNMNVYELAFVYIYFPSYRRNELEDEILNRVMNDTSNPILFKLLSNFDFLRENFDKNALSRSTYHLIPKLPNFLENKSNISFTEISGNILSFWILQAETDLDHIENLLELRVAFETLKYNRKLTAEETTAANPVHFYNKMSGSRSVYEILEDKTKIELIDNKDLTENLERVFLTISNPLTVDLEILTNLIESRLDKILNLEVFLEMVQMFLSNFNESIGRILSTLKDRNGKHNLEFLRLQNFDELKDLFGRQETYNPEGGPIEKVSSKILVLLDLQKSPDYYSILQKVVIAAIKVLISIYSRQADSKVDTQYNKLTIILLELAFELNLFGEISLQKDFNILRKKILSRYFNSINSEEKFNDNDFIDHMSYLAMIVENIEFWRYGAREVINERRKNKREGLIEVETWNPNYIKVVPFPPTWKYLSFTRTFVHARHLQRTTTQSGLSQSVAPGETKIEINEPETVESNSTKASALPLSRQEQVRTVINDARGLAKQGKILAFEVERIFSNEVSHFEHRFGNIRIINGELLQILRTRIFKLIELFNKFNVGKNMSLRIFSQLEVLLNADENDEYVKRLMHPRTLSSPLFLWLLSLDDEAFTQNLLSEINSDPKGFLMLIDMIVYKILDTVSLRLPEEFTFILLDVQNFEAAEPIPDIRKVLSGFVEELVKATNEDQEKEELKIIVRSMEASYTIIRGLHNRDKDIIHEIESLIRSTRYVELPNYEQGTSHIRADRYLAEAEADKRKQIEELDSKIESKQGLINREEAKYLFSTVPALAAIVILFLLGGLNGDENIFAKAMATLTGNQYSGIQDQTNFPDGFGGILPESNVNRNPLMNTNPDHLSAVGALNTPKTIFTQEIANSILGQQPSHELILALFNSDLGAAKLNIQNLEGNPSVISVQNRSQAESIVTQESNERPIYAYLRFASPVVMPSSWDYKITKIYTIGWKPSEYRVNELGAIEFKIGEATTDRLIIVVEEPRATKTRLLAPGVQLVGGLKLLDNITPSLQESLDNSLLDEATRNDYTKLLSNGVNNESQLAITESLANLVVSETNFIRNTYPYGFNGFNDLGLGGLKDTAAFNKLLTSPGAAISCGIAGASISGTMDSLNIYNYKVGLYRLDSLTVRNRNVGVGALPHTYVIIPTPYGSLIVDATPYGIAIPASQTPAESVTATSQPTAVPDLFNPFEESEDPIAAAILFIERNLLGLGIGVISAGVAMYSLLKFRKVIGLRRKKLNLLFRQLAYTKEKEIVVPSNIPPVITELISTNLQPNSGTVLTDEEQRMNREERPFFKERMLTSIESQFISSVIFILSLGNYSDINLEDQLKNIINLISNFDINDYESLINEALDSGLTAKEFMEKKIAEGVNKGDISIALKFVKYISNGTKLININAPNFIYKHKQFVQIENSDENGLVFNPRSISFQQHLLGMIYDLANSGVGSYDETADALHNQLDLIQTQNARVHSKITLTNQSVQEILKKVLSENMPEPDQRSYLLRFLLKEFFT